MWIALAAGVIAGLRPFGQKEGVPVALADDEKVGDGLLDGCSHVFIDGGSNIGVQVRKLYEGASVYPESQVHSIFNQYFGLDHSKVCTVGFEPNPHHYNKLKKLQRCYRQLGLRVTFIFAALATADGEATFNIDGDTSHEEWGSSLFDTRPDDGWWKWLSSISNDKQPAKAEKVTVPAIDFGKFINQVVAGRMIPPNSVPSVLMKLDIEGAELNVLPHLMHTGGPLRRTFHIRSSPPFWYQCIFY